MTTESHSFRCGSMSISVPPFSWLVPCLLSDKSPVRNPCWGVSLLGLFSLYPDLNRDRVSCQLSSLSLAVSGQVIYCIFDGEQMFHIISFVNEVYPFPAFEIVERLRQREPVLLGNSEMQITVYSILSLVLVSMCFKCFFGH